MKLFLFISGLVLLIGSIGAILRRQHMVKIAASRKDQNICTFARSFDFRNVDTTLIREVWNELQNCTVCLNGKPFPINAEDNIEETFCIADDDVYEIFQDVAGRLGISTEALEDNPYWGKVNTVKDLVLFLDSQPRLKNA